MVKELVYVLLIAFSPMEDKEWQYIYANEHTSKEECVQDYIDFYHVNGALITAHIDKGEVVQSACIEIEKEDA